MKLNISTVIECDKWWACVSAGFTWCEVNWWLFTVMDKSISDILHYAHCFNYRHGWFCPRCTEQRLTDPACLFTVLLSELNKIRHECKLTFNCQLSNSLVTVFWKRLFNFSHLASLVVSGVLCFLDTGLCVWAPSVHLLHISALWWKPAV